MTIPHPYAMCYHPIAYPQEDGTFHVMGKTYPSRDKFNMVGAKWDSKNKVWICTAEQIKLLVKITGLLVMIRVRVAKHCHEEEEDRYVTHKEVEYGAMLLGCGWCDTIAICGDGVKILKVIDEKSYNLVKDIK